LRRLVGLLGAVLWAAAPLPDVCAQTVTPPRLVGFVPAEVPPDAAQLEAVVGLVLTVAADGTVTDVVVASPAGHGLDEAAAAAARKFTFAPAEQDGVAVAARVRYDYRFAPPPPPRGTLEGKLVEGGIPVPRAEVVVTGEAGEVLRAITDEQGSFSVPELPPGRYRVRAERGGKTIVDRAEEVHAGEATDVTYGITAAPREEERGYGATARIAAPEREVTRRSIVREELATTAGTGGDPLRTIELLPGVARPPAGAGQLIVRGSSPEDTQLFVDGAQVIRIYHFGGVTSFVPARLLDRIDLFPGSFSVRYGRATGGVVEVRLRDPEDDRLHAYADIGLLDASAFTEGPIGGAWSFAGGVRRSTIDLWFSKVVGDDVAVSAAPVYLDYQLLVSFRPSKRDRARLQIYGSVDSFDVNLKPADSDPSIRGQLADRSDFHRAQLVWSHDYSAAVTHDLSVTVGTFGFATDVGPDLHQKIRGLDLLARAELRARATPWLRVTGGLDVSLQVGDVSYSGPRFIPNEGFQDEDELGDMPRGEVSEFATFGRPAAYVEAAVRPLAPLEITAGARVDYFSEIKATTVDPRLSVRWEIGETTTLKGAVGLFSQPPEYGSVLDGIGNPDLDPIRALHVSAGVEQKVLPRLTVGLEVYAKRLRNLVYADDAGNLGNLGQGRVYGAELAARLVPGGPLSGFLSYTLSRSERRESEMSEWRLFDNDQTHVLAAAVSWRMGRGWMAGATFRLSSGNLDTPVVGSVYDAGRDRYRPVYGDKNSEREPMFRQLDLRIEKEWRMGWGRLAVYLDVQNAANIRNQEAIRYSYDYRTHEAVVGLPILPLLGLRGEL